MKSALIQRRFYDTLPGGPRSPSSPLSPAGPLGPGAPVTPGSPVGPCCPSIPGIPSTPIPPAVPFLPFGPGIPGSPVGPKEITNQLLTSNTDHELNNWNRILTNRFDKMHKTGTSLFLNPLSPNSDQHQFSPNDIHTMSRD